MRPTSNKSIVALAAEQDAQVRKKRNAALRRGFFIFCLAAQLGGWWMIHSGQNAPGSAAVLFGLVGWIWEGGLAEALRGPVFSWIISVLVGGASSILYLFYRSSSFQWGPDISFYRAVLDNIVPPPFASPLSYLTAQALLPILPGGVWPDLPLLASAVFGIAAALLTMILLGKAGSSPEARGFALTAASAAALTLPAALYSARALGLSPGLGLALGLCLIRLLDERVLPSRAAFLTAGLMFSVQPAWGVIGLLLLFRRPWDALRLLPMDGWVFAAGFTPYLWLTLHAGNGLGSWGGPHPFSALLRGWGDLWAAQHAMQIPLSWTPSLMGWALAALWAGLFLIGWKTPGALGFLFQASAAGCGAFLFSSRSGGLPGTTSVWLPALAVLWWTVLYRGAKASRGYGSSFLRIAAWCSVVAALGLAFLPSERLARYNTAAPQRHVENLLATVSSGISPVVLLAEDPFEAEASSFLLARSGRMDGPLVISVPYLTERWYLAELIRMRPDILIATAVGGRRKVLGDLVKSNLGRWDLEWAVSEVPPEWATGADASWFKAAPRVLTQHLVGPKDSVLSEDPSPRYDMADLLEEARCKDGPARRTMGRYAVGLQSWAVAQSRAGRYPAAMRGFERALLIDPTYEEPRIALERLYNEKSMADAARLQFEQAARSLPPRIQVIDRALAKSPEAGKNALLSEKARLTDEWADALHHLGVIYEHQGRYDDSRKALEQVLQIRPSRVQTQLTLAYLFLKVGNKTQAEAAFKAVLQADPENKEAQAELWKIINHP